MADRVGDGEKLVAALAAEPGMAGMDDPRAVVFLWSLDGRQLLWASAGAASPGGTVPPEGARRPLGLLGAGLAPRSGFRLERLRLQTGRLGLPATFACRIVPFGEGEALVTAALPGEPVPGASVAAAPAAPAEIPEEVPVAATSPPEGEPAAAPHAKRGRRFVWQTDAEGRFTAVSPALAESVGPGGAAILGRRWDELLGRVALDESGAIGRALAGMRPWSRLPVLWRDVEQDRVVPVEISGTPVLGPDGRAAGCRGFGFVYTGEARPATPGRFHEPLPDVKADDLSPPPERREPVGTGRMLGLGDAVHAAAALTGTAGETVFGVLRAWFTPPGNEREPQRAPATEPDLPHFEPETAGERPPEEPGPEESALSLSERGALHEIARALQATGDGPGPDRSPPQPSAEIIALPPRPRAPDPGRLLDRLPIGIVVLREAVPVFVNRHLLDLSGHEDLPNLVAQGGLSALLGAGFDPGVGGPSPVTLAVRSGERRPFEMRAEPVAWGELPATLVSLMAAPDPEPEQRARALGLDLAGRERRLHELAATVELAADGVVTLDEAGRIMWMSRSAERLFGYAANEVAGDAVTALVVAEDHRATLACLEAVSRGESGAVEECEIRGRPREGAPIPLSLRVGRVAEGNGSAFSVAFRDVSRAKAMEEELREARGTAERASANRAEFLARISHEIRTPLTAITGFAELMLEERFGPVGSERYKGYIRDIHGSGGHVISLVNDLLDLAKVTSGRSDLSPTSLDLNAIARQCIAVAAPIAARERTIVRTSFAPGLPRTFADERSVRQIVLNVMSNAIRFTGAGGQVIVSTMRGTPGEVILRVRDTGPGMNRDEIDAALTPFRQVSTTRRGDGTGLGLPLSKALAEANGGVFTITSAPDKGTLIEIRLPVAVQARNAIAAE